MNFWNVSAICWNHFQHLMSPHILCTNGHSQSFSNSPKAFASNALEELHVTVTFTFVTDAAEHCQNPLDSSHMPKCEHLFAGMHDMCMNQKTVCWCGVFLWVCVTLSKGGWVGCTVGSRVRRRQRVDKKGKMLLPLTPPVITCGAVVKSLCKFALGFDAKK